jgi:glycosyltransferase involved in cell wall biosynthesis
MMTAFGWNDSGGGTTVPRLVAKELARRGWEVTVFHAAVAPIPGGQPYQIVESEDDGIRLIGVHNRPHGLFDYGHPHRELDDPPITAAFAAALDQAQPRVIHFHNLHNLGAALLDQGLTRGIPAYFTTHNYWLICPRAYLLRGSGAICPGPGDGSGCAECVGSCDAPGHAERLAQIKATTQRSLRAILAVSDSVRQTLLASGYPPELVDVVRQAMPHEAEIWDRVGRDRVAGRRGEALTVAFLGSAYPHKGPQLLVQAAQETQAEIRVRILGEVPPQFAATLRSLDQKGVVELAGAFAPDQIGELLREVDAVALPSVWWDCAPLAAAECLAAGTPLLVPRLGGLPEAIRDGVDGLTFKPLDAGDLARQLDRLALEAGLLERLQGGIEAPRAFAAYVDDLEAYYAGERPGRPSENRPARPPSVRWRGDHGFATSLSIINDRVIERLDGDVQRIAAEGTPLDPPLTHSAEVEVRHQWPPELSPPPAGRLAVIQPWEFGAIPTGWLGPIQQHVDELWVPSEFVRRMYLEAGIPAERVITIPNGVDLDRFTPAPSPPEHPDHVRFLFVGGVIWRKGPDVLLNAWQNAFPGREDVTLTIKDFGAIGVYRNAGREPIREYAASGRLPRVELIEDELSPDELIELYRGADVLVHPYRGEGFAMPVLEAMACGVPVIVTAGGPTDEFCPPEAGWRIRSRRAQFPSDHVDSLATTGRPWVLEPDAEHLVELLRQAAADGSGRRRRGDAGRAAAQTYSWHNIAERYRERLRALAARPPLRARRAPAEPWPLSEQVVLRVLATPAWRADDELGRLLQVWTTLTTRTTSACLYLLADPAVDGAADELEARALAAARAHGVDLDTGADINVVMEPHRPELDARIHAATDAYVPLHAACTGHERLAREQGSAVVPPHLDALASLLESATSTKDIAA